MTTATTPRGRHRALRVVPGVADASVSAPRGDQRTTTRCRPSELPTTVALRLGQAAIAKAHADAHTAGVEVFEWVRLTIESSRQCARAAALLAVDRRELERHLHAATRAPVPVSPVAVPAPTRAYLRSLKNPDGGRLSLIRAPKGTTLILFVPDELAVAWSIAAADSGEAVDAWAARQLAQAPRGIVAWELAAARRGCYLAEWILVTAASLACAGPVSDGDGGEEHPPEL